MREFVVLTAGRSGSTWVMSSLDSHPAVACYGELFHTGEHTLRAPPRGRQDYLYFPTFMAERAGTARERLRAPALWKRYLDGLYATRPGIVATGFKLLYLQARAHPWLVPALALRRTRVVHLIRDNPLDIVISQDMARARGEYHAEVGEEVSAPPRVTLDTRTLMRRIRREELKITLGRRAVAGLALPVLELDYDRLVSDPSGQFARVLGWLGAPDADAGIRSQVQRLNEATYRDSIDNYDQVERALHAGRRAELLARRG